MPAPWDSRLIVILNDNNMSIAPPVGALSAYLARLMSGRPYRPLRQTIGKQDRQAAAEIPGGERARAMEEYARGSGDRRHLVRGASDFSTSARSTGNNLDHLLPVLKNVRDTRERADAGSRRDAEGQGLRARRGLETTNTTGRRQVRCRDRQAGEGEVERALAYTKVFGESLVKEAKKDERIVAITAAMPSGTGIDIFGKAFPDRTFDVGIAEQHAVTFAGRVLRPKATSRSLRSIRRFSSAPMIRSCMTSRCSRCRFALRSTAPVSSAPTDRRMPAPSTSPISPACPASS